MRRVALTFVHGINNGPKERAALPDFVKAYLLKAGMLDMFAVHGGSGHYVEVADWESIGDFMMDLAALSKKDWCDSAVRRIGGKIMSVQDKLLEGYVSHPGEPLPYHIIVGHSMGQPLCVSAIADLTTQDKLALPTFMITLGGPLGNRNPAVKTYLQWATKRISWWNPASSLRVRSWHDIYNTDDPICCDSLLNFSRSKGYAPCRGVTKSTRFDWPGRPSVSSPLAEHSSYFNGKLLYDTVSELLKTEQATEK